MGQKARKKPRAVLLEFMLTLLNERTQTQTIAVASCVSEAAARTKWWRVYKPKGYTLLSIKDIT